MSTKLDQLTSWLKERKITEVECLISDLTGIARGKIKNANLARFPQILITPAIIAMIWQSLFSKHAPLDAIEMFRTHLDLIFGERRTT